MRKNRGIRFRIVQGFLVILAVLMLLPMIQTFLYSFSSMEEMKSYMGTRGSFDEKVWMDPHLVPNMFSLGQYHQILIADNTVLRLFVNSAMYAALILVGQALIIPALAFGLSRFRFPGRNVAFFGIILLMLLPFQVTMVPNVLTLRALGLTNTIWAVIMPMWFAPFYIFLIRQFMVGLPNELIEAAEMDGAGTMSTFLRVILPVCRPILGAAAALSFAESWNLVEQPLTYLTTRNDLQPLSTMFNQLVKEKTGFEFAGAALYILPALFVYLFFQEDILSGIQLTELK
ncbi:MAG: carbohydrate ABC transporter permease [Clostridiales bacterium]|nr:carbohydrate ABC transporter permease [Clostridia bacterium]MCR4883096.1 carbohydrate ABC transporter permease [Clostridiales bacterium]